MEPPLKPCLRCFQQIRLAEICVMIELKKLVSLFEIFIPVSIYCHHAIVFFITRVISHIKEWLNIESCAIKYISYVSFYSSSIICFNYIII